MSIKSGLADICRKVYEKGFVAYYDDNLPVCASDNSIYTTPYAKCKSYSLLSHVKRKHQAFGKSWTVSLGKLYSISEQTYGLSVNTK